MKIFVTGATGYIGRVLIERLARMGYEVHALYRDLSKIEGMQYAHVY